MKNKFEKLLQINSFSSSTFSIIGGLKRARRFYFFEKGTSIVEFAVIFPLLFLLIFGIVEFGVLMYDKAILTNASREGARFGAVYYHQKGSNNVYDDDKTSGEDDDLFYSFRDKIEDKVFNYCEKSLISFGTGSVFAKDDIDVRWFDGDTGDEIIVNTEGDMKKVSSGDLLSVFVPYNFEFLIFSNLIKIMGGTFQNGIPIEAETVMRVE